MKCHQMDAGLEREGEKRQESGRGQDIDDSLLHTPSSSFEDRLYVAQPPATESVFRFQTVRRHRERGGKPRAFSMERGGSRHQLRRRSGAEISRQHKNFGVAGGAADVACEPQEQRR
jgi:hypothetical protein